MTDINALLSELLSSDDEEVNPLRPASELIEYDAPKCEWYRKHCRFVQVKFSQIYRLEWFAHAKR